MNDHASHNEAAERRTDLAHRALLQHSERIRTMVECSHDAVVTIGEDGLIESWNGRAETLFGWSAAEAIGVPLSELIIPPAFRAAHDQGLARFLKTHTGQVINRTLEVMALNKVGQEVPVELSIWPFRSGERYVFGSFIRDVSARHRAEAQLRRQAEQSIRHRDSLLELSRLPKMHFAQTLDHILAIDARTLEASRVSFWRFLPDQRSIVCERLYRADPAASGDTTGEVLSERDFPDYFSAMASARPVVADDACAHPDTRAFASAYLRPNNVVSMLDTGVWFQGRITGVLCHEMLGCGRAWTLDEVDYANAVASMISLSLEASSRAQAEQETLRSLAREKELSEVRARFVSIASHEFRTPLSAIKSSVELLKDYGDRLEVAEKAEILGTIDAYVTRMTGMLDQVLQLGRADAGRVEFNPASLDLPALCRKVMDEVSAPNTGRHCMVLQANGDLRDVSLDARLLHTMLSNLLSNAVKYSPEGGQVTVSLARTNTGVTVSVADEGIGIPVADQLRLFESFFRARNVGQITGTGLGLAIVKRAVDLHGGSISLASGQERGTMFVLALPA